MTGSGPRVIAGRYELRSRIGEGNFSVTWLAADRVLGRDVAVKILREQYAEHPGFAARFENEARAAAVISHPNVVPVFDFGRDGATAYIVMQYVPGPTLKDYIRDDGPLPIEEAVRFTRQILDGLAAIHDTGIVHRDIKPQNVLLSDRQHPKLTDFGIARMAVDNYLTGTGATVGTAAYMAPEQASGAPLGPPADLYAVGVMLYEMLTGRLPFAGDSPVQVMYRHVNDFPPPPRTLNPSIPIALEAFVLRALAKRPADRFPDARTMRAALLDPAAAAASIAPRPRRNDPAQATTLNPTVSGGAATAAIATNARRPVRAGAPPPPRSPRSVARAAPEPRRNPWALIVPVIALLTMAGIVGGLAYFGTTRSDGATPTATLPAVVAEPSPTPTESPTAEPSPTPTTEPTTAPTATATTAATATATAPAPTATATQPPPTPTPEPPTPTPTPEPPTPTPTPSPAPTATPVLPNLPPGTPFPATELPQGVIDGPQDVVGADFPNQFTGAYKRPDGRLYGLPAAHLYGQGSGASAATVTLTLNNTPAAYAFIVLVGLDDERATKVPMRLTLNGIVIWDGSGSPFQNAGTDEADPSRWTPIAWRLPNPALLQAGANTLVIENTQAGGQIGSPPWILLTAASAFYQ